MFIKERNHIVILAVAVAWEPLLEEQEKEKFNKYQKLAVDLAIQPWLEGRCHGGSCGKSGSLVEF